MGCGPSKQQAVATPSTGADGATPRPCTAGTARSTTNVAAATGTVILTNLNDVDRRETESPARDRFLSYASGASTPNTSSGNISWDGNSDSKDTDGSRTHGDESPHKKRGNPKLLKSSGSAIGLDEIHQTVGTGLTAKVVHIEVPFGKPIEEVYDGVHNGPVLGSGVSGLVRLVTHKATGLKYAVKCLDLGLIGTKEGLSQLREEIFIMCQLDHPNIVRLEEVYESHSEIYLVQELCVGGELFDRLDEQPDYHYTEAECARLVKQMLSAVRYLHSKGIIHRDLKLENFLFSSKAQDSELKMIDFGLSKHFRFGEVHHEAVGTPYTVAPEVIRGSYDERCDIWAIGVITFLLLSGDPPFGGCGGPEPLLTVRSNILECKYKFAPQEIWGRVSERAKDFVRALLVVDPKKRPTAREAQKHLWLKEWASRHNTTDDNTLNPNVVKALVSFKEFSHMRKLLSEVLSFTLLPEQIKELRKEFETLDTDGSGEISLAGLKQVLVTNAGAGSLGALTEEEVEDIFNAMRVNKAETRIHWHEFIAAGLSQCQVDDRNLRLAFDRLDSDHKGYITLDDIMNLVGNDELHSEEQLRTLWKESMRSVNCTTSHIAYDNFLLLMKGQTKEPEQAPVHRLSYLNPVPEGVSLTEEDLDQQSGKEENGFLENKPLEDGSVSSLPNMGSPLTQEDSNNSSPRASAGPEATQANNDVSDDPIGDGSHSPNFSNVTRPGTVSRGRSKSLAEEAEIVDELAGPSFRGDTRRALVLPERDPKLSEELSKNQSALAVSRQLYRAHRQMRVAVMEASRRFEEEQARRARDALMAQKTKEAGMMGLGQAGLVMRHGHKVQVTTDAIRRYLEEYKAEQQELVEKATRRGGRGKSNRKKTISDMSALMNPSLGQDELASIISKSAQSPEAARALFNSSLNDFGSVPELNEVTNAVPSSGPTDFESPSDPPFRPSIQTVDKNIRKATVPGQFHETKDPFSSDGMYGGARIGMLDVNQIKSQHKIKK